MDMGLITVWLVSLLGFVLGLLIGHLWGCAESRHTRTSWDAPEPVAEEQPQTAPEPQTGLDIWRDLDAQLEEMEKKGRYLQ